MPRPDALPLVTTTFFLVRHAAHDRLGRVLCGRMAGVSLGEIGRAQALKLAERVSRETIAAVYTSPLERARETAAPIAARLGLDLQIAPEIDEIGFGDWSGLTFDELGRDPRWASWNTARSVARPPGGGETMLEAQARAVGFVESLRDRHRDGAAALVSHSDLLKAILAYFLGLSLDFIGRFEIGPASLSTLVVGDWGAKILTLNEVSA
jgi:probable phosphoglycerate mutase